MRGRKRKPGERGEGRSKSRRRRRAAAAKEEEQKREGRSKSRRRRRAAAAKEEEQKKRELPYSFLKGLKIGTGKDFHDVKNFKKK